MTEIVLLVEGRRLTGWEELTLTRSIEAVAGSLTLKVSDRDGFPVPEGAAMRLELGGVPMLTGWVDAVRRSFTARERSVEVIGRDRTGELVDCSPLDAPPEFEGLALDGLAEDLAAPFGIEVAIAGDPGAVFPRFAIQPSETVFEALERAARLRGVLLTTNGLGQLVLENPASSRASGSLVEGVNLISGRGRFDRSERFRRYVVHGQRAGSDLLFSDELRTQGEAFDDAVRKTRGLLVLAEAEADIATCQRRAEWEATVRRARGSSIELVVQGWEQAPGELWRPNQVVRVTSPTLRLDRDMLLTSARYERDPRSGTTTTLELVHPEAFTPKPVLARDSDLSDDLADPDED